MLMMLLIVSFKGKIFWYRCSTTKSISALTLSFTVNPTVHPIFQFADESITFKCSYPRAIEISDFEFDVNTIPKLNTTDKLGSLEYDIEINVAEVGEMSKLIISPKHDLTNFVAT